MKGLSSRALSTPTLSSRALWFLSLGDSTRGHLCALPQRAHTAPRPAPTGALPWAVTLTTAPSFFPFEATFSLRTVFDSHWIPSCPITSVAAGLADAAMTLGGFCLVCFPLPERVSLTLCPGVPLPVEEEGISMDVLTLGHTFSRLQLVPQLCSVQGPRASRR